MSPGSNHLPRKSEIALVERLRAKAASSASGRGLLAGIGDDCAIFNPPRGRHLVFTTDLLIEDVHFRRSTHSARDAGHKALARGLSDIAAMGATPHFCLVSLQAAPWTRPAWIDGFYNGLLTLAARTGTALAGGDLARAASFTSDIVVCGSVPAGCALLRSGACPGDALWVTGSLGASALGLATGKGPAWRRHLRPEPRLGAGRFLRGRATACMDLSDGLSIDLYRLARESGVAAVVDRPLPVFPGASLEQALNGGEDYELLFTAPAAMRIPAVRDGLPFTRIGTIAKGTAGRVDFFGTKLEALGYDHFR
ncbi:MAG: thiamine-phosphate kinase [Bryobacterales bacterium]|nr:thiamine-phosphate kinase [Bryobacterales bacterium]